jgi:LmbE family N-acetylglucosaminyl deacetylase
MGEPLESLFRDRAVLVYAAHPDDEVLGAGGTIAKAVELGAAVHVYLPATGVHARRNVERDEAARGSALAQLREDAAAALACLGVPGERLVLGDFDDNEMDGPTRLTVIHALEEVVARVRPDVILTHHWRCTNIDHQRCHEAAVIATRPAPTQRVTLLAFEVPSSTGYLRPTAFEPTLYVGLEERHVAAKIAAMQAYRTEARSDPHPRSPEVLRALAKLRGSEAGFLWAEAFQVVRTFG